MGKNQNKNKNQLTIEVSVPENNTNLAPSAD
jgi:hypothetical protein